MLAGNSSKLSSSSSGSSDPLRTLSTSCPQMGSAAAVATDHSIRGTDLHPDGGIPDPQIDASLLLSLPPFTSSDFLSTTLHSKPVTSTSSSTSQPTTLMSINGAPQNGLCGEDSNDCYPSPRHCHGSNSSSDNGVISPVGSQEDTSSEISSEQPGTCGSALSMGDVGGGKDLTSLADDADNGNGDDGIKTKQSVYLKNTITSLSNEMNFSSSETSPMSWIQSTTLANSDVNLVPGQLSPFINSSARNPDSLLKATPGNYPCSVDYLWQQLEKLMPLKHESMSKMLHQYGIGKSLGSLHGRENSEEDQFWDIVQNKSLCTLNIA